MQFNGKQYFTSYTNWEDFQAGMYRITPERDKDKLVINAIGLLKNQNEFYHSMREMIDLWKVAARVNLTNNQQNKRAWLGAAACCFKYNVPEYLTRVAWNLLNKEDQDQANRTAEKIIQEFNQQHTTTYAKTLFEQDHT